MKKIIKIVTFILCAAFTMVFSVGSFAALGAASVVLSSVRAEVGDTVSLNLMLSGNYNLGNAHIKIIFDNTKLQFVGAENGAVAEKGLTMVKDNQTYVSVGFAAATGVSETGVLVTLQFKVLGFSGLSNILGVSVVEFVDASTEEAIPTNVSNSIVAIPGETIIGDVNLNGTVEISDAIMTFMYVAGKTTLSESSLTSADVNRTGQVDVSCAIKIFMYVAGKITILQ